MPRSAASAGETSTKLFGVMARMPGVRCVMLPCSKCSSRRPLFRQIELRACLLRGWNVLDGVEFGLAIGEGKLVGEQQRRVGPVRMHRPLQTLIAFEPFVADAGKQRGQPRDLIHDLGGVLVLPVTAHAVGDQLNDLPVGLRLAQRIERLVDALNAAFSAGEGAIFLERRAGRQHQIGVARGLRKVDVLHDEELQPAQRLAHILRVRVGGDRVFALDVPRLQLARVDRLDHAVVVETILGRQGHAPLGLELASNIRIIDLLIAGVDVRHRAEVARALHVVMAA